MKKLLAMTLALSVCATPFTAFAEEEVTAESLLAAMQEYNMNVDSISMPMTMNLDAALKVVSADAPETSLGISMTGGFDAKEILDPLSMSMTGEFELSAMGMNEAMSMEMYMTSSDDGSVVDTYMNMIAADEESGWQHVTMDMAEILASFGATSMDELNNMSMEDMLGMDTPMEWTIEETDSTYEMSAQLLFSDLMPLIEESMATIGEDIGEEEMMLVEMILGSFAMDMSYSLDKETKAALSAHVDFNNSDLTFLNQMISMAMASSMGTEDGEIPEMAIVLNDFSMDMTYTYNDVSEIVVPEDALAAETIDVNEMMEEVTVE